MKKKFGDNKNGSPVIYIESYNERAARLKKKSPAVFTGFDSTPKIPTSKNNTSFFWKKLKFNKKIVLIAAAALAIVFCVPLIFAVAANPNEISKSAAISQPTSAPASPSAQAVAVPTATGGELISELTEQTVVATPAPANPAAVSVAAPASPTATPSLDSGFTVLSSGMSDPFVAMIQQRLMDLFYMEQDDPTLLFGPVTKQAIEDFQRNNGLPKSGIADIQTQTVMFSPEAKPYIVTLGDSGPDVQSIQDRLIELGYSLQSTGTYDADTIKAVQKFQTYSNLSADGNVGNDTQSALYSQDAVTAANGKTSNAAAKKSSTGSAKPAAPANPGKVEAFISAAMAELGKTYVLGGKGPNVFDCSGLVYYSLKASGNGIGYMTSYDWADAGQYARIGSMKDLQRGDVVCESGHVGIYMGNGQIVNASSSNGQVIVSQDVFSSSYWVGHFICGRRPLQ